LSPAYYHVYNRGNNRESIFFEDRNYRHFLHLYAHYVEPVADTLAYCLLRITPPPDPSEAGLDEAAAGTALDPSKQFGHLFNAYAKAINAAMTDREPVPTPVWPNQSGFARHFVQLVAYIHQNPEKHGFVDDFREWPYTSFHSLTAEKPTRLQRSEVLRWFGGLESLPPIPRDQACSARNPSPDTDDLT